MPCHSCRSSAFYMPVTFENVANPKFTVISDVCVYRINTQAGFTVSHVAWEPSDLRQSLKAGSGTESRTAKRTGNIGTNRNRSSSRTEPNRTGGTPVIIWGTKRKHEPVAKRLRTGGICLFSSHSQPRATKSLGVNGGIHYGTTLGTHRIPRICVVGGLIHPNLVRKKAKKPTKNLPQPQTWCFKGPDLWQKSTR